MAASARPVDRSALWVGGRDTQSNPPRRAAGNPGRQPPAEAPVGPRQPPPERPGGRWSRLARRYGWRIYALPLVVAATVFLVLDISAPPSTPTGTAEGGQASSPAVTSAAPTTSATTTSVPAAGVTSVPPSNSTTGPSDAPASSAGETPSAAESLPAAPAVDPAETLTEAQSVGALPAGEPFAVAGDGSYRVVPGAGAQIGTAATVVTYTIEIENGFTPAGGDEAFAGVVDATLSDARSWSTVKGVSLQRLDAADASPDFRITLTSQQTIRGICGFSVPLESSCYSREFGRVLINDARWVRGALSYPGDLTSYRQYAVNHEVGHALGYGHQPCATDGGLAPVMMQQSWSTSNNALNGINGSVQADNKVCRPNPWPDPQGSEGEATATTG